MYDYLPIIAPAWIAGSLLALLSAPLGCLVLWRRMAFFSDALAHGVLLGVGLAIYCQLPSYVGMIMIGGLVVAVLSIIEDDRLPNDALLSMVSVALLGSGLLLLTQLPQQQANILGYLFGNLLEVSWSDLPWLAVYVAIGLVFLAWIWKAQVKLATSAPLAVLQGIDPLRQRLFFMGLLAGFCTIALQAVGSLLISGLLILPALIARLWANSPRQMLIISLILAQVALSCGVWSSVLLDIQTGLAIVLFLAMTFFLSLAISNAVTR